MECQTDTYTFQKFNFFIFKIFDVARIRVCGMSIQWLCLWSIGHSIPIVTEVSVHHRFFPLSFGYFRYPKRQNSISESDPKYWGLFFLLFFLTFRILSDRIFGSDGRIHVIMNNPDILLYVDDIIICWSGICLDLCQYITFNLCY